jgi:predicted nucleotidyltransferase/biotin operon repressor
MLKESELKVLDHVILSPEGKGFISQIARDIGISKSEVSKAVKVLKQSGLVRAEPNGRNVVCSIDRGSPVITRLRIAFNLLEIAPKIEPLRKYTDKIILFGSCAQGTDTFNSDVDLFVIARDKAKINKLTRKIELSRPIQWVVRTPQEYVVLNARERVFAQEIGRGIVLRDTDETAGI